MKPVVHKDHSLSWNHLRSVKQWIRLTLFEAWSFINNNIPAVRVVSGSYHLEFWENLPFISIGHAHFSWTWKDGASHRGIVDNVDVHLSVWHTHHLRCRSVAEVPCLSPNLMSIRSNTSGRLAWALLTVYFFCVDIGRMCIDHVLLLCTYH